MEKKDRPLWQRITLWALCAIMLVFGVFAISYGRSSCARKDLENETLDFTVQTANGQDVSLADFAGKPVVVHFWAIWCSPCKKELPDWNDIYVEYSGNVTFVFVNTLTWRNNSVADVEAFVNENGYAFATYYDTERSAENACDVKSIPLTLFIGKDGEVKKTYSGAMPKRTMEKNIKEIL